MVVAVVSVVDEAATAVHRGRVWPCACVCSLPLQANYREGYAAYLAEVEGTADEAGFLATVKTYDELARPSTTWHYCDPATSATAEPPRRRRRRS